MQPQKKVYGTHMRVTHDSEKISLAVENSISSEAFLKRTFLLLQNDFLKRLLRLLEMHLSDFITPLYSCFF